MKSYFEIRFVMTAALALFVATQAYADMLPPRPCTLRLQEDTSASRPLGGALAYTSDPTGVYLNALPGSSSKVQLTVKEQEDWRGLYTMIPAFTQYLGYNPELLTGVNYALSESPRTQSMDTLFTQDMPASQAYSFVFDLNSTTSRNQLKLLLKKIGPTTMLSDEQQSALLASLNVK